MLLPRTLVFFFFVLLVASIFTGVFAIEDGVYRNARLCPQRNDDDAGRASDSLGRLFERSRLSRAHTRAQLRREKAREVDADSAGATSSSDVNGLCIGARTTTTTARRRRRRRRRRCPGEYSLATGAGFAEPRRDKTLPSVDH